MSSLKQPTSYTAVRPASNSSSTSYSSFAKSYGPGRGVPNDRPPLSRANPRPGHSRSKSQAPMRPRTAHGHREEEEYEATPPGKNGTNQPLRQPSTTRQTIPLHNKKTRNSSHTSPTSIRESSLATRFNKLSLNDDKSLPSGSEIGSRPPQLSTNLSNITITRQRRIKELPMKTKSPLMDNMLKRQVEKVQDSISAVKAAASPTKSPSPHKLFLTKDSNLTGYTGWDVDGRVDVMESRFKELSDMVHNSLEAKQAHDEALELAKTRGLSWYTVDLMLTNLVSDLESDRQRLEKRNETLSLDLDHAREEERALRHELEKQRWEHSRLMDDLERRHRETVEDMSRQHRAAVDELSRELDHLKEEETKEHQQRIDGLTRHYQQELEDERMKKERELQELRARMSSELQELKSRLGGEHQELELVVQRRERELQEMRSQNDGLRGDLERERSLKNSLQTNISELSASNTTLEAKINSLKSHVEFLESDNKAQSDSFANMEARLQEALRVAEEARQKLIKEETERRVLFNKYQELKGNIRVMCRVRPALDNSEGEQAKISFPDEKTSSEIVLAGPEEKSSLGHVTRKNYPFEFDRVFIPGTQNAEIFDEISQLVQSALDGYNVCIFCYGQTGSGKTYTMSSEDGMIPRATHMIYDTMTKLKEKSWEYTMDGSFVEVYNEDLNDLLTPNDRNADGRSRKLEIRHDDVRKQTTIMNCKSVRLDSPGSVEMMLEEAQKNRSVAATKANERSSRSHSVFVLKLVGENSATGERCEGTLNLVDLAGSERLKHSQAEGDRMKETQNINKSLSCLGDVIEALGKGSGHVPYRNSKLTHLLQYSLGGNSKTLMFVMVSPLETHLKETLTSLRFATKYPVDNIIQVHNTHIGTAKATKKIKGSDS
ncbi:LOW QUALITY PROTEIN: Kinesin-like protein klpA [Paramyrothecium foliicola]|nr:LOW QUALITY PROTEIN: Kinesin-like protein klpA [Paramyrothecium foliicola]